MKSPCLVIFSIALLFASASCKRNKDGVVLIDPDKAVPAVLEDVACDIKVIPLKSDRPIPGFTFLYFYDDYFFSTDLNYDEYNFTRVGVFDRQGNYIGTIDRHGRGHNEYLSSCIWTTIPSTLPIRYLPYSSFSYPNWNFWESNIPD